MDDFKGKAKFIYGFEKDEQLRDWFSKTSNIRGVAFVGRSNVGKSSTINTLFGKKTARVSKTPSRTRQINIFQIELNIDEKVEVFYLFDLPGYGHAEVSKAMAKNWNQLMASFFEFISPNVLLFNIQDSRHPLQKADKEFINFFEQHHELPCYLLLNKFDKLKTQKDRAKLKKKVKEILPELNVFEQIYYFSAEKQIGLQEVELSLMNFFKSLIGN